MPLFATLMASSLSAMVGFFARFMSLQLAQKIAAYTLYIATTLAFLASVYICLSSLLGYVTGFAVPGGSLGWVARFLMGLGMFIPANAGAVLACVSSVWIGTSIYKVQKQGLHNYGS
jgi:hypothetical protein